MGNMIWDGATDLQEGMYYSAKALGYKTNGFMTWSLCVECGRGRWVEPRYYKSSCRRKSLKCQDCYKYGNKRVWDGDRKLEDGMYYPGRLLGYKGHTGFKVWSECPDCGRGRWLQPRGYGNRCNSCTGFTNESVKGENNWRWKGGRHRVNGYIAIVLPKEHPYYCMTQKRTHRVLEHRLVFAISIGRPLEKWEVVHHINGNKTDNRLENLRLLPNSTEHLSYTAMERRIKEVEKRVLVLEIENHLLKTELEGDRWPER